MIRGKLSELQRERAWQDIDPDQRSLDSALPYGDDPNNPTPEQRAFRERIQRERVLDENYGQGEIAQDAGRIATGAGQARQSASTEEARKKREENAERARLMAYLAELDRQIAHWDGIIDGYNRDIAEIDRNLEQAQAILEAMEADEFDPENEEHRAFLMAQGINPDQSAEAIEEQLRGRMDNWRAERGDLVDRRTDAERQRDALEEERAGLQRELDNAQAGPDVSSAESRLARADNTASVRSADAEITDLVEAQEDEFDDLLAGIDDVALMEDEYPSYADEIDPNGAAQNDEAEEPPQQDHAQPDQQPDPLGPRMGG